MKIYISGKMTGVEDFNIPAFNEAEYQLKKIYPDAVIINPARHPLGLDYETYMEYAMIDIKACDQVYQLNGWEQSKGAMRELKAAIRLNKEVITGFFCENVSL